MGILRGTFLRRSEESNPSVDIACELFCRGSENRIERASKCPLTFPIMQTRIMQRRYHAHEIRRKNQTDRTAAVDSLLLRESRQQHNSGM